MRSYRSCWFSVASGRATISVVSHPITYRSASWHPHGAQCGAEPVFGDRVPERLEQRLDVDLVGGLLHLPGAPVVRLPLRSACHLLGMSSVAAEAVHAVRARSTTDASKSVEKSWNPPCTMRSARTASITMGTCADAWPGFGEARLGDGFHQVGGHGGRLDGPRPAGKSISWGIAIRRCRRGGSRAGPRCSWPASRSPAGRAAPGARTVRHDLVARVGRPDADEPVPGPESDQRHGNGVDVLPGLPPCPRGRRRAPATRPAVVPGLYCGRRTTMNDSPGTCQHRARIRRSPRRCRAPRGSATRRDGRRVLGRPGDLARLRVDLGGELGLADGLGDPLQGAAQLTDGVEVVPGILLPLF